MNASALKVITTEYSRGAVVKLARSAIDPPIAKYVIERDGTRWLVRRSDRVLRAGRLCTVLVNEEDYAESAEAITAAERACERIRAAARDDGR